MSMFRNLMSFSRLLPKEYQQVEYIQSSGNQYIDTGISGNEIAEYQIVFDTLGTTAHTYEQYFAGQNSTSNSVGKIFNADNITYYQSKTILTKLSDLTEAILDVQVKVDEGVSVNGEVKTTYTGLGWGSVTFWVFNSHQETYQGASMKLYNLIMWSDGVKVREFIPCYRKSDDEIGLYDLISNSFFTNEGSGTFTKGADV